MSQTRMASEQRTIDVDVSSLDTRGKTVVGYAAVYDVLSEDLGGHREKIAQGAFADLVGTDVRALLNHDPNEVLGRTKSGLRLFDEQRGLRFELDLPDSPLGQNVREAVRRGDVDGASFRFEVGHRPVGRRRAHRHQGESAARHHDRDIPGLSLGQHRAAHETNHEQGGGNCNG